MSDLWLNIRFGCYHLQAGKWFTRMRVSRNEVRVNNPVRFKVYMFIPFTVPLSTTICLIRKPRTATMNSNN